MRGKERVWSKGGKSEGLSDRKGSSECVPMHIWRLEKRGITQRNLKAVVHRHMSGQGTEQLGARLQQTPPGLEKRSGTESGK